jgi:hypothetical protein
MPKANERSKTRLFSVGRCITSVTLDTAGCDWCHTRASTTSAGVSLEVPKLCQAGTHFGQYSDPEMTGCPETLNLSGSKVVD